MRQVGMGRAGYLSSMFVVLIWSNPPNNWAVTSCPCLCNVGDEILYSCIGQKWFQYAAGSSHSPRHFRRASNTACFGHYGHCKSKNGQHGAHISFHCFKMQGSGCRCPWRACLHIDSLHRSQLAFTLLWLEPSHFGLLPHGRANSALFFGSWTLRRFCSF